MKFLSSKKLAIFFLALAVGIFALIFYLFDLPFEGFFLGAGLLCFISLIGLFISFIYFEKDKTREEIIKDLKEEIQEITSKNTAFYRGLESYFILWIHQIKTPITAAKLIASTNNDRDIDRELNEIENYTNLALSYLKLKEPNTDLNFINISIDDLIKPLIKKYRWNFIDSSTKLIYEPIESIVLTDANWSRLMVEQVLNNALKYARAKTIEIYFKDDKLFIKDTGVGIRKEDLPLIFTKGYSGFNGTATDKASGLGLYIVESISRRLDQEVRVTSVLGEGTTFSIEFHKGQSY